MLFRLLYYLMDCILTVRSLLKIYFITINGLFKDWSINISINIITLCASILFVISSVGYGRL